MRVASSIAIAADEVDWRSNAPYNPAPARVVLKDDEGGVMAEIPLKDLAAALAPFFNLSLKG